MQPRVIRMKEAPTYLGMCTRVFNELVRPFVREFRIGVQGIGFDREDLDRWLCDYLEKSAIDKTNERADDNKCSGVRRGETVGGKSWREKKSAVYMKETGSGISTRLSEESEFTRVLERVRRRKLNAT